MIHRKIPLFAAALILPFVGGCYHETWTYRAVPNVNVAREHELGSQGPLVLVALDDLPRDTEQPKRKSGAAMIDSLTADQIAHVDPHMQALNRNASAAHEDLMAARAAGKTDDHPDVGKAKKASDKANKAVEDYVREYRASHRDKIIGSAVASNAAAPAEVQPPQTILLGNVQKDFGERGSSVSRTFVLFIDGLPRPGKYWFTSDNSVLITSSAWSPPARTRVGLTGSIEILKVDGSKIYSHVALHENFELDTAQFVEHYWDPMYAQTPWVMNGKHTFIVTDKNDPAFEKAAVHWMKAGEERSASAKD